VIYEIQSKNDLLTGAVLIINIPEEELDIKALYTIIEDRPEFILPFQHRIIDGVAEFEYHIGTHSKLQHISGERYPKEYMELWSSVLSPLCECGDWFLKPYSFALDINYLYCDKTKNTVSYVYIPSIRDYSNYSGLKEMAAGISGQITVTDSELENKVLRAIMMEFNPKVFMQVIKNCSVMNNAITYLPSTPVQHIYEQRVLSLPERIYPLQDEDIDQVEVSIDINEIEPDGFDDIIIDLSETSTKIEKKAKSKKDKQPRTDKSKKTKQSKSSKSIFRKKTDESRDVIVGISSVQPSTVSTLRQTSYEPYQASALLHLPSAESDDDVTQIISYESEGAWLRLVGNPSLPTVIGVPIDEGGVFTVGRFDSASSRSQSNFEFDRMTKAISRRHAAIERYANGYALIDLSSSAGTFLDGVKLPPNTPCELQSGCLVSFGNCGADYVWEV
jgi:hypothetical protein